MTEAATADDHGETFVCVECDRLIWRAIRPDHGLKLCAECISLPGWTDMPEIAAVLDPDYAARKAANEKD